MERWVGKVAIVSGASSGIGAAIATKLVEEGLNVVGVARRKDRLELLATNLAGKRGSFYLFQADMTKEEDVLKTFMWTKENVGLVHILINNAGIARFTTFLDLNLEETRNVFDINVLGLLTATKEAIKIFKENNINGHIVNINSIAGHRVSDFSGTGIYTASKHAVTAITKALALEVKKLKLGTKVTSLSPGLVETDIVNEETMQQMQQYSGCAPLKVKDIADATIYILSTPPNCQIDELTITPINVNQ